MVPSAAPTGPPRARNGDRDARRRRDDQGEGRDGEGVSGGGGQGAGGQGQCREPGCKLYALHKNEAAGTYVFMERYVDQAAGGGAPRHRDYFKALGRKMGEYMDGRADVARLTELIPVRESDAP